MMKWLMCLLSMLILWVLLFWTYEPMVLAAGLCAGLFLSTWFSGLFPENMQKLLNPKRWGYFLLYLPYFFWHVIRANFDVMLRVIPPELPIRPGIVKVRTTLTSDMAKTFLANSITLTPGTLTMDIDGQDVYVHWINIDTEDVKKRTEEICGRFEPLLRRIFE